MSASDTRPLTGETTELLQALIRNECVNDGTPDSGGETRNADLLQTYLEGAGLAVQQFESGLAEGRSWPGSTARSARRRCASWATPTSCRSTATPGPATRSAARSSTARSGAGAIDMLNITASMATAFKDLARNDFRPKGTLIASCRRRGGGRAVGCRVDGRRALGCRRQRLRPDRDGRLVVRRRGRCPADRRQHRREGIAWRRLR